jgi:arylsulfatase A-like enzyme
MKRLIFSLVVAAMTTSSLCAADRPPNIVFILADDLGWSDTTLYGQTELYQTPNLERLAARGMIFDRAYTASPLCSPTRSSILTGLHPARTGLTTPNCHMPAVVLQASVPETAAANKKRREVTPVTRLDTKYRTLSTALKEVGYTTAHFGKWHLGSEPYSPLEHGFDIDIPHWPGPGPAGSFVAPWKFKNFKEEYPKEHIEDRMGDEAVAFMEAHQDEPFFLNYWQFSVHAPFDAKAELIATYRDKIDPEDEQRSPTYAAMVHSLDDNVGKMLDALDRLKIADNTIVVFFSDNGGNMYNEVDGTTPTSNRPLRGGKGNNWDGGVRVPAVVVWPGKTAAGVRSDALITSTDFYPTLLEMIGREPRPGKVLDGISIVPALRGEAFERDAIFTFFPHSTGVPDTLPPSAAIYEDDWKLFRFFHEGENGAHVHQLYHLGEDIGERSDVAAEHQDRVAAMAKKLDAFLEETKAVTPQANLRYDPSSAALKEIGWQAAKDCSLTRKKDRLEITTSAANAKVNVVVKPPVEAGDLVLRIQLKSDQAGKIDLRWAEQGVKPLYFKDRLKRSGGYVAGESQIVDIPFSANQAVTSMRIDFMQPAGTVEVDRVEILRAGKSVKEWDFSGGGVAKKGGAAGDGFFL